MNPIEARKFYKRNCITVVPRNNEDSDEPSSEDDESETAAHSSNKQKKRPNVTIVNFTDSSCDSDDSNYRWPRKSVDENDIVISESEPENNSENDKENANRRGVNSSTANNDKKGSNINLSDISSPCISLISDLSSVKGSVHTSPSLQMKSPPKAMVKLQTRSLRSASSMRFEFHPRKVQPVPQPQAKRRISASSVSLHDYSGFYSKKKKTEPSRRALQLVQACVAPPGAQIDTASTGPNYQGQLSGSVVSRLAANCNEGGTRSISLMSPRSRQLDLPSVECVSAMKNMSSPVFGTTVISSPGLSPIIQSNCFLPDESNLDSDRAQLSDCESGVKALSPCTSLSKKVNCGSTVNTRRKMANVREGLTYSSSASHSKRREAEKFGTPKVSVPRSKTDSHSESQNLLNSSLCDTKTVSSTHTKHPNRQGKVQCGRTILSNLINATNKAENHTPHLRTQTKCGSDTFVATNKVVSRTSNKCGSDDNLLNANVSESSLNVSSIMSREPKRLVKGLDFSSLSRDTISPKQTCLLSANGNDRNSKQKPTGGIESGEGKTKSGHTLSMELLDKSGTSVSKQQTKTLKPSCILGYVKVKKVTTAPQKREDYSTLRKNETVCESKRESKRSPDSKETFLPDSSAETHLREKEQSKLCVKRAASKTAADKENNQCASVTGKKLSNSGQVHEPCNASDHTFDADASRGNELRDGEHDCNGNVLPKDSETPLRKKHDALSRKPATTTAKQNSKSDSTAQTPLKEKEQTRPCNKVASKGSISGREMKPRRTLACNTKQPVTVATKKKGNSDQTHEQVLPLDGPMDYDGLFDDIVGGNKPKDGEHDCNGNVLPKDSETPLRKKHGALSRKPATTTAKQNSKSDSTAQTPLKEKEQTRPCNKVASKASISGKEIKPPMTRACNAKPPVTVATKKTGNSDQTHEQVLPLDGPMDYDGLFDDIVGGNKPKDGEHDCNGNVLPKDSETPLRKKHDALSRKPATTTAKQNSKSDSTAQTPLKEKEQTRPCNKVASKASISGKEIKPPMTRACNAKPPVTVATKKTGNSDQTHEQVLPLDGPMDYDDSGERDSNGSVVSNSNFNKESETPYRKKHYVLNRKPAAIPANRMSKSDSTAQTHQQQNDQLKLQRRGTSKKCKSIIQSETPKRCASKAKPAKPPATLPAKKKAKSGKVLHQDPEFDDQVDNDEDYEPEDLESLHDDDDDEYDEADQGWRPGDLQEVSFPNRRGFDVPNKIKSPVEYFNYFFDEALINYITEQTNLYTTQEDGKSMNVTPQEIRAFFGIIIYMGICDLPAIADYWSGSTRVPQVAEVMSRVRFQKIHANIHFYDKETEVSEDKYLKVRYLFNNLRKKCQELPHEYDQSVDESMVAYKGKKAGSLRQYMPDKPSAKWGFKMFVRAGTSGMIYDFIPYCGSETFDNEELSPEEIGMGVGAAAVISLCKSIPDRNNTTVTFDNFYTGLPLMLYLKNTMNLHCMGTVRRNRTGNCPLTDKKAFKKNERGAYESFVNKNAIIVVQWLDSNPVCVASSFVGVEPLGSADRYSSDTKRRIDVPCPQAIMRYNRTMGGVDLADMHMALYKVPTKARKWYFPLVGFALELSLTNAWLLYCRDCEFTPKPKGVKTNQEIRSSKDFRVLVSSSLKSGTESQRSRGRPALNASLTKTQVVRPVKPRPCDDLRVDGFHHWPEMGDKGRCRYCKTGFSRHHCTKCQLALCLTKEKNCFTQFHLQSKIANRRKEAKGEDEDEEEDGEGEDDDSLDFGD